MANYIDNVVTQTAKLDWAMPFQRTGAFPLDRSTLFSSFADAEKYAKGDGSDERKLGGTSYVGQVISVLEDEVVSAYIITPSRGLMKLAATTSTGDLSTDVANLQGALNTLKDSVTKNTTDIGELTKKVDKNIADITAIGNVDQKIQEAIAAAPHLSRKIVNSVEDIDVKAEDATKFIYMVPRVSAEAEDKYDEYMVLEIAGSKVLEKVGDWKVDLSGYATADAVNAIRSDLAKKVDKVDGSRLMTNDEGDKLAGIAEGAQKNVVNSASGEFTISPEGELGVKSISIAKVDGLSAKFDAYTKNDDKRLLTDDQKKKLEALDLGEDNSVSIGADKISGLDTWLGDHASSTPGLSENNFDNDAKAKLEALLNIKSVDTTQLEVSDGGQLSVKAIAESKVIGLTDKLKSLTDKNTTIEGNITTLTNELNAHVKNYDTLSETVNDLDARLTWWTIS